MKLKVVSLKQVITVSPKSIRPGPAVQSTETVISRATGKLEMVNTPLCCSQPSGRPLHESGNRNGKVVTSSMKSFQEQQVFLLSC